MIRKASVTLAAVALAALAACGGDEKQTEQTNTPAVETPAPTQGGGGEVSVQQQQTSPTTELTQPGQVSLPGDELPEQDLGNGLKIATLKAGEGVELAEGDKAKFATKIASEAGAEMFSGEFEFVLGSGQAFPGFDKGVRGMKLGEARRIKVPAEMGIKLNADDPTKEVKPQNLVVYVQLIEVAKAGVAP